MLRLVHYPTAAESKVNPIACLTPQQPITTNLSGARITSFEGLESVVRVVHVRYDHMAAFFDPDAYNLDFWHAGIFRLIGCDLPATQHPVRWTQTVFTGPRDLHFHTRVTGPLGEICWMIIDPTISIGGVDLRESGRLHTERHKLTSAVLRTFPELAAAVAEPAGRIGIVDAA